MIVDNARHARSGSGRCAASARRPTSAPRPTGQAGLTYWQGTSRQGIGTGRLVILDQTYKPIRADPRSPTASGPDLHEFIITPRGTALFITYPIVAADLSEFGGSKRAASSTR
jgi:hypothetical protein